MKRTVQLFLAILLACPALLQAEENLPPPFEASFKIFKKGLAVAEMHRSLTHLDNGEFIYSSETSSTGLTAIFYKLHVLEKSRGILQDQQLMPLDYSYDRIKKKKKSHKKTTFDWKTRQANYTGNGNSLSFDLQTGMTDKLLYQINIMHDLEMGNHPTSYTVVDGAKIKTYHFEYLGEEIIETPIGKFNTIKLNRHKPGDKGNTILWCARELHHLPVRVESIDNDGSITTAMIDQLHGQLQRLMPATEENHLSTKNSE